MQGFERENSGKKLSYLRALSILPDFFKIFDSKAKEKR